MYELTCGSKSLIPTIALYRHWIWMGNGQPMAYCDIAHLHPC